MILWQPVWKPFLLILAMLGLFLVWWFSQKPSGDRDWAPGLERLPQVTRDWDWATIQNVRNTDYRSLEDFTPHYETRTYHLSNLVGVDALIAFWGSRWMSHPMCVFDFGPDGRVCISIEVRYRRGQQYNLLRSLYRQQELVYVVCDERDAILRRTKFATGEDVYLYRLDATEDECRQYFMEYAEQINSLVDRPCWYQGLTTNCTTSIYFQRHGKMVWDWRLLVNGRLDRMIYDHRWLEQRLPFDELKRQSHVNPIANRAPADGFGDYLRHELPGYSARESHK